MYSQIVNPRTGKKVSVYKKIGQQVMQNYINQLGGTNPHTGKKWSSYACKGLGEDECEDFDNFSRCKWLPKNNMRKAHCKKIQNSSRKRAQRNLKNLKDSVKYASQLDLSQLILSDEDINYILTENNIEPTSIEGVRATEQLKKMRYNPHYRSKFGGDIISKYNYSNPNNALFYQASDVISAYTNYDDSITNETWDIPEPEYSFSGEPPTDEEMLEFQEQQEQQELEQHEIEELYQEENHHLNVSNDDFMDESDEEQIKYDEGDAAEYRFEQEYYDH